MLRKLNANPGPCRGFAARAVAPAAAVARAGIASARPLRHNVASPWRWPDAHRTCSGAAGTAFRPPYAATSSSRRSVATSAAPAPPAPSPELFVGVDFGTSESGFAYVRPGSGAEGRVQLHTRWPDQPQGAAGPKTRTAILYKLDEQGRVQGVESWGWTARQRWLSLSAEERPRYAYLENFKLLLHEGQGQDQGPLDTVCPLPPNLTPTQVAEDFLTEMKRYALLDLRRQGVSVRNEAVRWCVTLPAMWTEADKRRVREAAEGTGMGTSSMPLSLLLTLEPEAAVLAVTAEQKERPAPGASPAGLLESDAGMRLRGAEGASSPPAASQNSGSTSTARPTKARLSAEDVVLVLDCGGGTVDLTLARVYGTGRRTRLEEEAVGRGLLAGSRFVDAAAFALIRTLVGEGPWDEWRKHHLDEWAHLEERWEAVKRTFVGPDDEEVQLILPQGLVKTIGHKKLKNLPVVDDPSGDGSSYLFRVDTAATPERLLLPAPALEALVFRPVVDQIMKEAKEMLDDPRSLPADKVLLVGGFAASPYLQRRAKDELGGLLTAEPRPGYAEVVAAALAGGSAKAADKARLLIPAQPAAAVVVGAVRFGQQPGSFTARRCRLSYGVEWYRRWTEEDEQHRQAHGYPVKVVRAEDGIEHAEGCFRQFVRRGQLVGLDEVVCKIHSPFSKSASCVSFPLYATRNEVGRYTCEPGMRHVGNLVLELPPGWSQGLARANDYNLQTRLSFGATELTLVVRDTRTGNAMATRVVWDGDLVG